MARRTPPATGLRIPILLRYRDADGSQTERVVLVDTLRVVPRDGGGYESFVGFSGICTLRRARRTFRADRIITAADPATGEVIHNLPAWFGRRWDELAREATGAPPLPRPAVPAPALPRPPPNPSGMRFRPPVDILPPPSPAPNRAGLMVIMAILVGIVGFLVVSHIRSLDRFASRQPTAPPAARIPPPPLLIELRGNAFWLAVGLACDPLDRRNPALSLAATRSLPLAGPDYVRAALDADYQMGWLVGHATRSEAVCARGIATRDGLAAQHGVQ